eukprot:CAMPEP_0202917856 /NCGR_PEP_ID=MMETSP1392-20130828/72013_1 /ASSEMBLY_ACC=CAM_ASM_000868 /TAXON_ID=225041 /ORGANISM="Chlamydomonas chlamydogama, Strain SAG 11-48b" /LENGTH=87 /DNA_ID=CAMNT_0049610743 /DNA_START=189 /DNA_END=449 /DNA_ORIENTATION=+
MASSSSPLKWTKEQLEMLLSLVDKMQGQDADKMDWQAVADELGGVFTRKQCREKYQNYVRPGLSTEKWTCYEYYLLAVGHSKYGKAW